MPWDPPDAVKKNARTKGHPRAQRAFAEVADKVLQQTGDEGRAVREGNAAADQSLSKERRNYRGRGRQANNAKARTGKTRAWTGG